MSPNFRCLLPLVIISLAYSLPHPFPHPENITVSVPQNSTNHGNSQLVCTPSKWTDVVEFFILYFVMPAATVKSLPGQSIFGGLSAMCAALLFPTASVTTGIDAVFRCAALQSSPLLKAHKAGALFEVVRADDWEPQHGDYVRGLRDIPSRLGDFLSKQKIRESNDDLQGFVGGLKRYFSHWKSAVSFLPRTSRAANPRQQSLPLRAITCPKEDAANDQQASDRLKGKGREVDCVENQEHTAESLPPSTARTTHARLVPHRPIRSLSVSTSRWTIDRRRKDLRFKLHDGSLLATGRLVHGVCRLPPGFELSIVDPNSTVLELKDDHQIQLGSSYNLFKGLAAIAHLVWASILLYKMRGDQFRRYRLSAFAVTVIPFFFMSLVNLMGSILTPDYPVLYMVKTEIMIEAERREGACFEGVVGRLGDPERPINAQFSGSKQENRRHEIYTHDSNKDTRPEEDAAQVRTAHEYSRGQSEGLLQYIIPNSLSLGSGVVFLVQQLFIPASHTYLGEETLPSRPFTQFSSQLPFRLEDLIVIEIPFILRYFFPNTENLDSEVYFNEALMLSWVLASHLAGRLLPVLDDCIEPPWKAMRNWSWMKTLGIICATAVVLTICGFVIRQFVFTGQMIMDYGHCVLVD